MRYKAKQYAEAFADALGGATPESAYARIRAFVALLARHRALARAPRILPPAVRLLAARAGARRVSLESASALPLTLHEELMGIFGGKAWLTERLRPELLAGVRILIDDETLIDASGKRRLAEIFPNTGR